MANSSTLEPDEPGNDVAEEMLVQKKVHQFYFVKFSPYEEQIKARIQEAEKMIAKIHPEKLGILEKLQERESAKKHAISKHLGSLNYYYRVDKMDRERERNKFHHLQLALDKLSFANSAYQGRPINLCISDGEFDKHKLQFLMRHKTNNVAEERRIFRDIKSSQGEALKNAEIPHSSQLEELEERLSCCFTRWLYGDKVSAKLCLLDEINQLEIAIAIEKEKSIAFAHVKGKIWNSLGSKDDLQNQVKLMSSQLVEVRPKIKHSKKEYDPQPEAIQKDINILNAKLLEVYERKEQAHQCILKLRTQLSDENACYDQYVSILENARKLAEAKDVEALAELSHKEVEKFMSQWNTSDAFREGYEKRVSGSLENRELCRDGRMKNPGEKEVNVRVKTETPLRRRMKWQRQSTRDSKLNMC